MAKADTALKPPVEHIITSSAAFTASSSCASKTLKSLDIEDKNSCLSSTLI